MCQCAAQSSTYWEVTAPTPKVRSLGGDSWSWSWDLVPLPLSLLPGHQGTSCSPHGSPKHEVLSAYRLGVIETMTTDSQTGTKVFPLSWLFQVFSEQWAGQWGHWGGGRVECPHTYMHVRMKVLHQLQILVLKKWPSFFEHVCVWVCVSKSYMSLDTHRSRNRGQDPWS